ncbi:hypothetical protein RIF29_04691 [Crotalaria pallida]|uniref:Uncharacterized protein n=1 Tax=Crotalaria pallida TaxID=3830 RepID=A0AAN9J1H8_CROPI
MGKRRGRPPKTPSSTTKNDSQNDVINSGSPQKLDFMQLDEEDIAYIDALSPKQAELWMQKIDVLRAKIKEKTMSPLDDATSKEKDGLTNKPDETSNPSANPNLSDKDIPKQVAIEKETIPPENVENAMEAVHAVLSAATANTYQVDKGKSTDVTTDAQGGKASVASEEGEWISVNTMSK